MQYTGRKDVSIDGFFPKFLFLINLSPKQKIYNFSCNNAIP